MVSYCLSFVLGVKWKKKGGGEGRREEREEGRETNSPTTRRSPS